MKSVHLTMSASPVAVEEKQMQDDARINRSGGGWEHVIAVIVFVTVVVEVSMSDTDTWLVLNRAGCVNRGREGEVNRSWTGDTLRIEEKGKTSSVRWKSHRVRTMATTWSLDANECKNLRIVRGLATWCMQREYTRNDDLSPLRIELFQGRRIVELARAKTEMEGKEKNNRVSNRNKITRRTRILTKHR